MSVNLQRGYQQSKYAETQSYESKKAWAARIEYGFGDSETIKLARDVGVNPHEMQYITHKCLASEQRTGTMPLVELYSFNPNLVRLAEVAEVGTKAVSYTLISSSLLAGFLDRYRMTLAAKIDGIKNAIGIIGDLTQPCRDKLPQALENIQNQLELIERIKQSIASGKSFLAQTLPSAASALSDAETSKNGLEVCANLASDFTKIVEPMQKVNEAMAGKGFATKLNVFVQNVDMTTVKDALKDYSPGEQSLGFLLSVATSVGVGFSVKAASKTVCTDVLNLSEKHAGTAANVAGIAAGLYIAASGGGITQAATIGLYAMATQVAAKTIGLGIRAFRYGTGL